MRDLPPLRRWILSNKYYVKTNAPKECKENPTHYLLDGGIWKVPKNQYLEFLRLLATDLQNGHKYYLCENRTEVFKFICDLDFFDLKPISLSQLEVYLNVIQAVVHEYYAPDQKLMICSSDTKIKTIDGVEYTKSGFHCIWPKIWITKEHAKQLRLHFIEALILHFGQRGLHNTWEDVVDLSVYEDNGLRMIGCRKMGICKTCKNKPAKRVNCTECNETGHHDEGRVYKVVKLLYTKDQLTQDHYVNMLDTSIYNYADLPETKTIKDLGSIIDLVKVKAKKATESVEKTDEICQRLQKFIRRHFKEHYSECIIRKVSKRTNCYYIEVDTNFCMNVDREHSSSSIYFQITPTGCCQRCFSKKETSNGCRSGPCRTYSSNEVELPKVLSNFLFGKVKKQIVNFEHSLPGRNTNSWVENKQRCLLNCQNILAKLEKDLKINC